MKRIFALLLAISMLLSLTLPAYAEETAVVEEIVEEVQEEAIEEIEEETTDEMSEVVVEEVAEEIVEEAVEEETAPEEVVEEIIMTSSSKPVGAAVAAADDGEMCYWCAQSNQSVPLGECREHHGDYTLWMHMPQRDMSFLRRFAAFCGESFTTKLVVGNMASQRVIDSVSVRSIGADNVPYANPDALTIVMAEPTENDPRPDFTVTVNQPGVHLIRFEEQVNGQWYSYDVTVQGLGENDTLFYATRSDGMGYYSSMVGNGIWHDPAVENYAGGDYKLYLKTSTYEEQVYPANLFTTADPISITPKENNVAHVEVSAVMDGLIGYRHWDGNMYYIPVGYDGPDAPQDNEADIYFRPAGSEELLTELIVEKEVPVIGELLYGSAGAHIPLPMFERCDNYGFNIDPYEGMSKLTGFFVGAQATIYFRNASFTAKVPNPNAGDVVESGVKKLFVTNGSGSGNTIHTYWDLSLNPENPAWSTEYGRRIFFGTSEANSIAAKGVRVVAGDSIELTERQGDYKFVAKKEGYTILAYTDPDSGLDYYFPVSVSVGGNNSNKMARNYVPIGNITSGMGLTGWAGMETLDYYSQIGNYYVPGSTDPFMCTLGLLVRENDRYVDISRLSDVTFEVMGCNVKDAVTLGEMFTYNEEGRFSTYAVRVSGRANTSYQATVAVSYTLDGTKRFTHQINLFRNPNFGEVEIFATEENLGTAGQLNAVLSSWESFVSWVKDTQDIDIIPGMPVTLHLPVVNYDDIIVAQSMSPMNRNNPQPITLIKLWGSSDGNGHRTTMCGLIEKNSLVAVGFINFEAIKGKSMTTTGEKKAFTCGILADYKNSFRPVYDEEYLDKYCGGELPSLELPADRIQDYGDIFNTGIDLGQVHDCTFVGFDYGTRSTPYGFIGSQQHNLYKDNYYGLYMDNNGTGIEGGDDSADAGNATHTDYTYLTFENNEYAVRMVSIPCDASPYRVRVHDSNFIDNFREFWIDENGTFYFYRNYFAGKWQENNNHHGDWTEYKDVLPSFDDRDQYIERYYVISEHRPGRVHFDKGDPSAAETLVILNPCRSTPDFNENIYWFYGGEGQYTLIERGDNTMPISGDAVAELKDNAEIAVVENGESIITYTFQGKGGKAK